MNTVEGKPWLRTDNTILLFDYVQVFKCIRNNWITEKCGELKYEINGDVQIARWSHLNILHSLEKGSLVKLSKLNDVAIAPKPIERQRVQPAKEFSVMKRLLHWKFTLVLTKTL